MHVEKHWVRPATLSEKRLCKIRAIIFSIIFVTVLILLLWLYKTASEIINMNQPYSGIVIFFLTYIGAMVLDAVQVFGEKQIRINDQADFLTRDKWYHFFTPLGTGLFTAVWVIIFLLIGSIGFFIYSLLTGKPI